MKQRKQSRPYSAGLRQVTIEGNTQQHRGIQFKGSHVTLEQLMLIKQEQNYANVIDQSMEVMDLMQKQQSNVNMISSASQRFGTIGSNRWKNYEDSNLKKPNLTNTQQDISRVEKEKKTIDKFGILQLIEKKKTELIDKVELIINEIKRKKKFDIGFHEQMKKDLDFITEKFKKHFINSQY